MVARAHVREQAFYTLKELETLGHPAGVQMLRGGGRRGRMSDEARRPRKMRRRGEGGMGHAPRAAMPSHGPRCGAAGQALPRRESPPAPGPSRSLHQPVSRTHS